MVKKTILNNVSGSCGPGELVAILGASGAGKTTMMDTLSGRINPSAGTYTMNGMTATKCV